MAKFKSITEAADAKGCTRQAIYDAIDSGKINVAQSESGKVRLVIVDGRFDTWHPSPTRQKAGKQRSK